MMNLSNLFRIALGTLTALAIFAGCNSNDAGTPLAPVDESDQIDGLTLIRDGREVALVENSHVSGLVAVKMGQNSEVYKVEFYNTNGEFIEMKDHQKLGWKHEDSGIVTFKQHNDLNQWQFRIQGKKQSKTTFSLRVENGKNGNSIEYSSPPIRLEVR